jgi:hypothetical protein
MDPRDFIALAARLAAGSSASECRTAISRSYYAVFNVGAAHLRDLGFSVGKGAAAHGEVQRCLSNSGLSDVVLVGSELNNLHSSRNRADYQLERPDVERPANAQAIVALARNLIQTLDMSIRGPERVQLQATIRQWRRDNGYP